MSTNPKDSNGRTVKPNGELCKRMRIERGWDVTAMAGLTGLTTKTVESVEVGNRCFVCTLKAFSDAFKLSNVSELLDDPKLMPTPITGTDRVQVKIKLWLPFADYDFTKWLVEMINKLIKLIDPEGDIEVTGIAPGSIIVTLEMNNKDARKTVSAFGSNELDDLQIASITTNLGYGEPVEFKAIDRSEGLAEPSASSSPPLTSPPPQEPEKSWGERLSTWLFGEESNTTDKTSHKKEKSKSKSKLV